MSIVVFSVYAVCLWARFYRLPAVSILLASRDPDVELYVAGLLSLFPNVPLRKQQTSSSTLEIFVCAGEVKSAGIIPLPDNRIYRSIPTYIQRNLDELLHANRHVGIDVEEQLHEAVFSSFMHIPTALCTMDAAPMPRGICKGKLSSRSLAELYLADVLAAKDDSLICASRVVDDVLKLAVKHHESVELFSDVLKAAFSVDSGGKSIVESLLANRILFMSASLTATGSNKLEMVFGVPALWFTFLQCSSDSIHFVKELYEAVLEKYGWDYHNFARLVNDTFGHDRPEIVRHSPRIFRALNKSRSGKISLDELCAWLARKLSTRSSKFPDQHLLSTLMSLRLPFVLFLDKKDVWPRMECSLKSLSDDDVHI